MRALLPVAAQNVDVHAEYARDWTDGGGIRANMISSVDGGAAAAGLSAGLQTAGDNRVYAALRDLADVVLVGSGTVRAEGYGPVQLSTERTRLRREYGMRDTLPIAVASRSLNLDLSSKLFASDCPQDRPIVLTCDAADTSRRASFERVADVVTVGATDLDPRGVRHALAERGLTRVLFEGGPTLLGQFAGAGAVDELCLSLSPLLVGPGASRIVSGAAWPHSPRSLTLRGLLEEDGALFLRLVASRS